MRWASKWLPTALAVIASLRCTGTALGDGERPTVPAAPRASPCLERPIVVAYLHQLQDRVMDRWIVPEDTLANQAVVLRFRLSEDGSLLTYKLVSWTSRRIANSVELAVAHSGPFGSIPENATCLVG
jgi:hypothetical protein